MSAADFIIGVAFGLPIYIAVHLMVRLWLIPKSRDDRPWEKP